MIGGKSQGAQRPTALSALLNSSSYGRTIPTYHGTTKGALLLTWLANLRLGGSGKKFKNKKKGTPAYVANVDLLIGSNPIEGALQVWMNNFRYPLNFINLAVNINLPFSPFSYTIVDTKFYFLIGMTAELTLSGTFNDYGAPGPVSYSGTYEMPLWNCAQHGSDLVNAGASRFWPFIYKWVPADGNVVTFPFVQASSFGITSNAVVHFYYAQLSAQSKNKAPITFNRMNFEQELGSGTEYSDAGLSSQQIIYPFYAGLESSKIDLGSSGLLPDIRVEIKGSNALYSQGDADFVDMIEDTIKSGQLQTLSQLGLIHRGLNCNDLPGFVQKSVRDLLTPLGSNAALSYYQPNQAGSVLIAFYRTRDNMGSVSISDLAGNSWTPIFTNATFPNCGMWYANAIAFTNNAVTMNPNGYDSRAFILEGDPGFTKVENTNSASGTSGNMICTIATAANKALLVAMISLANNDWNGVPPPHWKIVANMDPTNTRAAILQRVVNAPGSYTINFGITGGSFAIGMLSIVAPQPAPYPQALGNILDSATLDLTRTQCRANGLIGSVCMDAQRAAADWLKEFYQCANAAPVWSGFVLKSIPKSEVSAVGNGVVYTSPTSTGPVLTLTESDLIGDASKPLVTVERTAQVDANNILQIEHVSRSSDYNVNTVSQPESGAIALFGPRKLAPLVLHEIQDAAVARKINAVMVKNLVYLRNKYSFTMQPRFIQLEAMDLIAINESKLGIVNLPVRITKIEENDKLELDVEAEQFVYGANSPDNLPITTANPNIQNLNADPGSVNTPIIFEPVPRLSPQPQVWAVVSAPSAAYGGSLVYLSTDGGVSYNQVGSINGNATTGHTTADWPIANDPDTSNNLPVDLTESLGTLSSYSATDRDNFTYPCYIAGGNATIPYGLMTYNLAVLTAANKYTLMATGTGNELRRCVFGAPDALTDVDHPINSRWAFLNPLGIGIFKINLDPSWIGKTIYFKFLAFNSFGTFVQDLSAATAYPYTVIGTAAPANPNVFNYTITGGALTNPTPTTIHMAQATATFPTNSVNYNARTFTIPAPSVPTRYYVTIFDPQYVGDTGSMTNLTATCQTSNALVGVPGNIYIGSIVALPAGGGTMTGPGGQPQGLQITFDV